ncbi:MAG: hypothetical protein IJW34_07880 [Clostridia bacterium]|nr:hypothetical protein [Clostridia bacterium]
MKKLVLLLCLCTMLLAGCNGKYYYVSDGSSQADTSSVEISAPVPLYVFGEKGFYDTVNDAEFYPAEGIYAKEVGDLLYEGDGIAIHRIGGTHEDYGTYLLCDGEGRVYKNADLPWTVEPGAEGFGEAYPALEIRLETH